jgi:hypothetical protein
VDIETSLRLIVREELASALTGLQSGETKPVERVHDTIDEFAQRWSSCTKTVRKWTRMGMPFFRIGKELRIPIAKANAWLESGGANNRAAARAVRNSIKVKE